MRKLSIVDMSCGGAVTPNVLRGGQFFQGPQVRAITADTRLVTITVGGNDINYVGDLSLLAARHDRSLFGWLARRFSGRPETAQARNYAEVQSDLLATLNAIHARAPAATVVVATYPTVLPPAGTCASINLSATEVDQMRDVANRLAAATKAAAQQGGAILVDMNTLGATHNACAPPSLGQTAGRTSTARCSIPTVRGDPRATAEAISRALDASPGQAIAFASRPADA